MMDLTRDAMMAYLRSPDEQNCILRLRYTTIVQKSYGIEKRFFIPAPIISLEGEGWDEKFSQLHQEYKRFASQKNIQNLCVPAPTIQGAVGVYEVPNPESTFHFELSKQYRSFLAKSLYIRSAENRNFLKMAFELQYNNGCRLGSFLSENVKVISKASKAKNSVQNLDFKYLSISSGQEICLSNRSKVPPVTRFVTANADGFSVALNAWTPLSIYQMDIDLERDDNLYFQTREGPIYYGDIVRLVDKHSGMSLPRIRICKVNKDKVVLPTGNQTSTERELVNQMQKIVLQTIDEEKFTYLYFDNNGIAVKTEESVGEKKELKVLEAALLTIACTVETEFKFFEAMGPTLREVIPSPICYGVNLDGYSGLNSGPTGDVSVLLSGKHFTDDLNVWLGACKCHTVYRATVLIEFIVPRFDQIYDEEEQDYFYGVDNDLADVPVLLVRSDGVIFPTGLTFTYQNQQVGSQE